MIIKKVAILIFFVICFSFTANAQQLVFEFTNPNFGGNNYYNYNWLLSSAQAQNKIKESSALDRFTQDPLADFQASLNRQILSQLSRQLIENTFGETQLTEGRYDLGDYVIDISPGAEGITVTIFDVLGGGETTVIVPYL